METRAEDASECHSRVNDRITSECDDGRLRERSFPSAGVACVRNPPSQHPPLSTVSTPCSGPGHVDIDTNTAAAPSDVTTVGADTLGKTRYFIWTPPSSPPANPHCQVCNQHFNDSQLLATHFHQYHLNPHHLSTETRRKYRLSNFLVNRNEDEENKTEFPGLYRCDECFNVFNDHVRLKQHRLNHTKPRTMAVSKYSREDFEDVSPRKRSRRSYKNPEKLDEDGMSPVKKLNNNVNGHRKTRTRTQQNKFAEFYSDHSDEYNSDSDFDGHHIVIDGSIRRKNRKSRSRRSFPEKSFDSEKISSFNETKDVLYSKVDATKLKKSTAKSRKNHSPRFSSKQRERNNLKHKKWRLNVVDHSKIHNVVQEIVEPHSDFLCLGCSKSFTSFSYLSHHRISCNISKASVSLNTSSKSPTSDGNESVCRDHCPELYKYVTAAVTSVPETTFNYMHGKIIDLKTEDAQKLEQNFLNEIGLVKLNYSGNWSVKDVWETGCWEPSDDQLSWQQYELSSLLHSHAQSEHKVNPSEENKTEEQLTHVPETDQEGTHRHKLMETMTTQIVDRRSPLITNTEMSRRLLAVMSGIPWTEQGYIKQRLDSIHLVKRTKRQSVVTDSNIRQSNIASLLDLKQTGKSIKYMKQAERESVSASLSEMNGTEAGIVEGSMSGEWVLGHSYICSVCGVEYDDMTEVLHHKWEAHPHCLVSHLSVRDNVTKPPDLMVPQVGPSTVTRNKDEGTRLSSVCSNCQQVFEHESLGLFHSHILECGGISSLNDMGKKKKRKTGAGGLKSTVRMLKMSESNDAEDESPKKKPRPPPKVLQPLPLIPTHSRTTRYKETMKKEAKKKAAKERRVKKSKGYNLERKKIVSEILDHILSEVDILSKKVSGQSQTMRGRRSRGLSLDFNSPKKLKPSKAETFLGKGRQFCAKSTIVNVTVFDDENLAFLSDLERVAITPNLQTTPNCANTGPQNEQQSPSDCKNENNRILRRLESTLVTSSQTPARSRIQHSVEIKVSAISRLEEGSSHEEVAMDLDISAITLASWWSNRSEIRAEYENKLANKYHEERLDKSSQRSRNRSREAKPTSRNVKSSGTRNLKRISYREDDVDLDLPLVINSKIRRKGRGVEKDSAVSTMIHPNHGEEKNISLGEQSSCGSRSRRTKSKEQSLLAIPSRLFMPLEVKQSAIRRMQDGISQGEVAKDLDISLSTVASWWRKKDSIINDIVDEPLIDDMGISELEKLMSDEGKENESSTVNNEEFDDSPEAELVSLTRSEVLKSASPRPQSGLQLISSNYCSSGSEEDL